LTALAPLGRWAEAPTALRVAWLPSNAVGPLLPPWLVADMEAVDEAAEVRLAS